MKTTRGLILCFGLLALLGGLSSCANSVLDPTPPLDVIDGDTENADTEQLPSDGDSDKDGAESEADAADTDSESDAEPENDAETADADGDLDGDLEADAEPDTELEAEKEAEPETELEADSEAEAPRLAFGEPCANDPDCESGLSCLDVLGTKRCTKSCLAEGALCPEGAECIDYAVSARKPVQIKVCAKSDSIHKTSYGTTCRGDWDCVLGLSCPAALELCTKRCTAPGECPSVSDPAKNICADPASVTPYPTRKASALYCFKVPSEAGIELGESCLVNEQCASLVCLADPAGGFCSQSCAESTPCPAALPACTNGYCQAATR